MKKSLIYAVLLGAAMLASCGSKTDVSEKNFSAVIANELKKVELCLPFEKWPYRVVTNDSARMEQMAVLEAAGLVSGADFEADEINIFRKPTGRKIKLKSYSLTGEGKKFFRENGTAKTDAAVNGHLCYGKLALDKVIKWEGIKDQMVLVTYSTELDSLTDWVKKPELQAVFPGTVKFIADSLAGKEEGIILKLTSLGWEPATVLGLAYSAGSEPVIMKPDRSIMSNPADYLSVATPATGVVSTASSTSVPTEKVETPPAQLQSSTAKHPQVKKTVTKNDKNSVKETSSPQVRYININE